MDLNGHKNLFSSCLDSALIFVTETGKLCHPVITAELTLLSKDKIHCPLLTDDY